MLRFRAVGTLFLSTRVPPCAAGSVCQRWLSSENAGASIQHPASLSAKTKDRSATSSTGAEVKPSQGLQVPAVRTPAKHAKIGAVEAERTSSQLGEAETPGAAALKWRITGQRNGKWTLAAEGLWLAELCCCCPAQGRLAGRLSWDNHLLLQGELQRCQSSFKKAASRWQTLNKTFKKGY